MPKTAQIANLIKESKTQKLHLQGLMGSSISFVIQSLFKKTERPYLLVLDNKEEAADLYVYRVAEYKAIQIGKVTRVLKETAVDCIINDGQNNFTQDKMKKFLTEPITQILSNGKNLDKFKVGDAPFSPACDYMQDCNFNCRPDADIDEDNLNLDTYDEKFIAMNSEKILQRIRMLMKESFFYKKQNLIDSIKVPKA